MLPSRALSSAQAESIVVRCSRPEEDVLRNDGGNQQQRKIRQRLFDPSGYRVARDPSRRSQLEARPWMRRLRSKATVSAGQHEHLNGVALTARNSHQINQRLPQPGRAAHRHGEWYLAKECVGSNRRLTRTIATSRSDDDRGESHCSNRLRPPNHYRHSKKANNAQRYRYAGTPVETANA